LKALQTPDSAILRPSSFVLRQSLQPDGEKGISN
jgi:hypothetical protein